MTPVMRAMTDYWGEHMTKLTFTPLKTMWLLEIEYAGGSRHITELDSLKELLKLAIQYVDEDQQEEAKS